MSIIVCGTKFGSSIRYRTVAKKKAPRLRASTWTLAIVDLAIPAISVPLQNLDQNLVRNAPNFV